MFGKAGLTLYTTICMIGLGGWATFSMWLPHDSSVVALPTVVNYKPFLDCHFKTDLAASLWVYIDSTDTEFEGQPFIHFL